MRVLSNTYYERPRVHRYVFGSNSALSLEVKSGYKIVGHVMSLMTYNLPIHLRLRKRVTDPRLTLPLTWKILYRTCQVGGKTWRKLHREFAAIEVSSHAVIVTLWMVGCGTAAALQARRHGRYLHICTLSRGNLQGVRGGVWNSPMTRNLEAALPVGVESLEAIR